MSNKKEWMYKKLNRLVKLCKATEPEKPNNNTHLFMPTTIDAYDMLVDVEDYYNDMSPVQIREIMIKANKIWKFRKKVYNGEIDWNWQSQLDGELEAMILQGSVINAIKHYRKEIEKETGNIPSLREGKDYVDKIRTTMGK
jgi:hypothetical protein|tara:strand:- start:9 stop:431 length:423 start_codon:yes stop_codon:yes gene_type:complete